MKHAVVIDELSEQEIRPLELFDEYLELMSAEATSAFSDGSGLQEVACPGCGESEGRPGFEKGGFAYRICNTCDSLYASPRPTPEALERFRSRSKALAFWADRSLRETAEVRREVSAQRARWLAALADEYLPRVATVVDIGPALGVFMSEVEALGRFERAVGVEWRPEFAQSSRAQGLEIVERPLEELTATMVRPDAVTAFDLLPQLHSPREFLRLAWSLLSPGGLVLLTTSTISGFDLRVLWERARNIYFPQQINILSIEGIERMATDQGFEILELSTPGQLDVSSVAAAIEKGAPVDRFVSYMMTRRSQRSHRLFQEFLQQHLLSSHVRVALRKPSQAPRGPDRRAI